MKFNNLLKLSIFIVFSLSIIGGCAGNSKKTLKSAPKWFEKVPEKKGFKLTTGTGKSADYQQAINKAKLEAKADLGDMVRSEIKSNVDKVFEENTGNPDSGTLNLFKSTIETTFSTLLEDWTITKKEVVTEGDNYFRAYVLLEWNEGKAHQKALNKIKSQKEIYDAVRASDMIQEMEDKVEAYCQRYGCD